MQPILPSSVQFRLRIWFENINVKMETFREFLINVHELHNIGAKCKECDRMFAEILQLMQNTIQRIFDNILNFERCEGWQIS